MGGDRPIRVRFDTAASALRAYREGLRLGVVAIPDPDGPPPGKRVEVRLDLSFARKSFSVEGEVTERTLAGTVIHLDLLPLGVHELFSDEQLEPGLMDEDSMALDSEDSQSEMTDTVDPEGSDPFSVDEDSEALLSRDDEYSLVDSTDGESGPSTASLDTQDRYHSVADDEVARPWPVDERETGDGAATGGGPSAEDAGTSLGGIPSSARMSSHAEEAMHAPPPPPGAVVGGMPVPDDPTRSLPAVPRFEGTVEESGWAKVLLTIMDDERSGVLVVDSPSQRCWIYCHAGSPVHVVRNPPRPGDALEPIVEQRALLDPGVAERCRFLADATGRSFLSVLMRLQLVDEAQLHALRTEFVTHALLEVVTEVAGPFRFFDLPELAGLFHHTPAAVMDALLRWALERNETITQQQAEELRRRHAPEHVFMTTLGQGVFKHVELRPEEDRTMRSLLYEDQTLGEVVAHSRLGDRQLIRLVLALFQIGLVELGKVEPGPARERRLAEGNLRGGAGRLRRDHFTLVGAHWADPPSALEQALERTRALLDEAPASPGEARDLAALRDELATAVARAADILLDPGLRRRYRESLVDEDARRLASQQLFRRGKIAARRDELDEARRCMSMVVELDPGGPASRGRVERASRVLEALVAGEPLPEGV